MAEQSGNGVRRRALVTGAGAGLGRDVAIQLAARGGRVMILDINARGLAETESLIGGAGGTVIAVSCDLTADGSIEDAIERMQEAWGGIDILVNNAGYGVIQPYFEATRAVWMRTLSINVAALAMACSTAGRVMRDQRSGRIVNITSPASRMPLPDYAAYSASKAAVDSITRASAVALAPYGVLVNSLAPGMMDTEMQRSTEADLARIAGREDVAAFLDERTRRVPLGRRADIAEIAAAVVWLCLDASPYMTAERLNMSGGLDKD